MGIGTEVGSANIGPGVLTRKNYEFWTAVPAYEVECALQAPHGSRTETPLPAGVLLETMARARWAPLRVQSPAQSSQTRRTHPDGTGYERGCTHSKVFRRRLRTFSSNNSYVVQTIVLISRYAV